MCQRLRYRIHVAAFLILSPGNYAFHTIAGRFRRRMPLFTSVIPKDPKLGSWGIADDWSSLSPSNPDNISTDYLDMYNTDITRVVARRMEQESSTIPGGVDFYVEDLVDRIHDPVRDKSDPPLFDYADDDAYDRDMVSLPADEESIADEIAMLVRCNQFPSQMLIQEGRFLPPLHDSVKYNVSQLVHVYDSSSNTHTKNYEATEFLVQSVSRIFEKHALSSCSHPNAMVLTADGIAAWMSQSTGGFVGKNDRKVTTLIAKYGSYGSGVLSKEQLINIYVDAIVDSITNQREHNMCSNIHSIESIWKELAIYGIDPPVVTTNKELMDKLNQVQSTNVWNSIQMDECEILEWTHEPANDEGTDLPKSSHMLVDFCSDKLTPKRLRDGDFVFVEEESCIGCRLCVDIAASTFKMLENGRARSFYQGSTSDIAHAVAACPVNCIKNVSFRELKELETFRDHGDGREDHKHLGRAFTPLHVSRRSSDAAHKSSWYHHLKNKCSSEKRCPQRGCFDCPMFGSPGSNPYFQKHHREAERIRAKEIIDSGELDSWRKFADL